jgi:membrane associated rhomboid family serine protease
VNGWQIEPLSINPMIGPSAETLIKVGAKQTSLIVQENEWFRLFSPMVLHAGIIHFVLNMVALWFIGYAVEMNHGFFAIAILFIVPAIGGTLLSALFLPEYISVGASGGIFGLIGACIADITTNWNLLFSKEVNISNDGQRFRNVKVLVWLLVDILLNVLIGLTPFVDNFTHLGGMVYGFLCALTKLERLSKSFFGVQKGFLSRFQNILVRLFGTILSIALILITFIVLIRSDGKRTPCKGCRYVSCVPFPFWAEYEDKWWYCDDCDNVEVEVRQNTMNQVYSSMNMTCPDDEIVLNIDLSVDAISDKAFLQKQLPKYCRENCDGIFAN